MTVIQQQYRSFLNPPQNQIGNLSPLQVAAAYYMDQGQQIPFFINNEWLVALNIFCNSGILTPQSLGSDVSQSNLDRYDYSSGVLSIIDQDGALYLQRRAPDCGPDDVDRYDQIYIGQRQDLFPNSWTAGGPIVRGGSAANGVGGPWGTGGIDGPSPTPLNGVDRPPPIYSNISTSYASTTTNRDLT